MAKFKLTDETKQVLGYILHRIEATEDFGNVKKGDKGGWIEKEGNLSQNGDAWVYGDAKVYDNAEVFGDAEVYDNAEVFGDAKVYGDAWVFGDAKVFGNACVYGDAWVYGDAKVFGNACVYCNAEVFGDAEVQDSQNDYILFKNWWSSGRFFTWTRSNNMWRVGCFYGTGEELIAKAYQDSEKSGREYERVVRYVESILADKKKEQEKQPTTMKITKHNGTYSVHFDQADTYPMFGGYGSIEAAKQFVRRTCAPHRVVFIHLLPRTWWVVKF